MQALLRVVDISKSYRVKTGLLGSSDKTVLHHVSFSIQPSQIVAIVGESGSGKSTLARQVVNLEKPDNGQIYLQDRPLEDIEDVNRRIRIIFQNPLESLNPRKRVLDQLKEPLLRGAFAGEPVTDERAMHMLRLVGLDSRHAGRYPHMFSGGQCQRIAIARALILHPQLIVADEPVSALDVSVQGQILNLVLDLKEELSMSWLFITHDLNVARSIADEIVVLFAGRVMEMGPADEIFRGPLHPYTRDLLTSVPLINRQGSRVMTSLQVNPPPGISIPVSDGCAYYHRCSRSTRDCLRSEPEIVRTGNRSVSCFRAG